MSTDSGNEVIGRDYPPISISGSAQVQLGDRYDQSYHVHSSTVPQLELPRENKLGLLFRGAPEIDPKLFIGRQSELQEMERMLKPQEHTTDQRKVVLGGMGGIGKTQLAITFAKMQQRSYDTVLWLNATTEPLIRDSIRSLAPLWERSGNVSAVDDGHLLAFFCKWLSLSGNTRWLLILDNYDDPESYDIKKFLPYCSQGSIIVTTRQTSEVAGKCACPWIRVTTLEPLKEGLEVLATRSGRDDTHTDQAAYQLAKRFHGLPLALASAGAFLHQNKQISFEQYLVAYETRWVVSSKAPKPLAEYDLRTLYTTWDISYDQLTSINPDGANMLMLLAYFDNERISHDHMKAAVVSSDSDVPPWMVDVIGDDTRFAEAMGDLHGLCLLDFSAKTKEYSMHNCIHDWTLEKLNNNICKDNYRFAVRCVAYVVEDKDFEELQHPRLRSVAAHAARLSHQRFLESHVFQGLTDKQFDELRYLCDILYAQSHYHPCIEIEQRLRSLFDAKGQSKSLRALSLCYDLGVSLSNYGKYDEAGEVLQSTLQERTEQFGMQDVARLKTEYMLSDSYFYQGKYERAEQYLCHSLEGLQAAQGIGPDHDIILHATTRLATIYKNTGRFDAAERFLQRALGDCGEDVEFGKCSQPLLYVFLGLADVYSQMNKRLDHAEKICRQVLYVFEARFGPDHYDTLFAVKGLADVYHRQGRLKEAEEQYEHVIRGRTRSLGDDHLSTSNARYCLAHVYYDQKRWADSEDLLLNVVERSERVLGAVHPDMYYCLELLGLVYHIQGNLDAAEAKFAEALACAQQLPDGHREVERGKWWLAHVQEMREKNGVCCHMAETKETDTTIVEVTDKLETDERFSGLPASTSS